MTDDPNEGLLETAAAIRKTLNDPDGLYSKNPDAKARLEMNLQATLLRAGAKDPVETAQSVAEQQHEGRFSLKDLHPNVTAIINERTAELGKLDKTAVDRLAADLREELGAETYDRLVKDAGSAATPAVRADAYALKMLANHGKYMSMYRATAPGARK